jgi:hypothetical protein
MIGFFPKIRKYLIEVSVIFIGVMMAFIAENWRANLQDIEDFRMILDEIKKDIRFDSIEIPSDKMTVNYQINCIDQLLNDDSLIWNDSIPCLDLIRFNDWPDYVLTGFDQLKNSKIISVGYNDQLMFKIYEYYQWVDYHYLLTGPAAIEVHELQEYLIKKGFPPIKNETFTEGDIDAFRKLRMDTEFITRLKYLRYNREEQLRIYETMERKSSIILDMFNNSN